MNDKYQEALDSLIAIERERTFRRIGTFFHTNCDALQELVDKETPKKTKVSTAIEYDQIEEDWYEKYYYYCPNCDNLVDKPNYCPHCGQKLDWSEKDE